MPRSVRVAATSALAWAVLSVILSAPGARAQEASLEGHWEGTIEIPGTPLAMDVDFRREDGAWAGDISIPVQNAKDLPLAGIVLEGGAVTFAIAGIPGDPTFSGTLSEDGDRISGELTQGGQTFPFTLAGAEAPAARARRALEGLDEVVEKALADFEVPGLGLAVVVDGEVVLSRGYGVRDLETGEPVTADTLFAIGSCTKAFTTLLLGTLVDEGLVDWDEPVRTYLPEFRMLDDHATRRLTVRDLVTHRSGLPRHDFLWYNTSLSRDELVQRLRYLEPFADLRERYHYQNLMFLTAGYLAGRVAGRSWEDLVRERIFEPVGMVRSNFSVADSQRDDDFASPHSKRDDVLQKIPFRDITVAGPAGSINSSVAEMARWLQLHLDEGRVGGRALVQSATAREMFTPQTVMDGYPTDKDVLLNTYGLGWVLSAYRGHYRAAHGGGIDGFIAMTTVLPLDGVGVIALSNRDGQGVPELVTRHVLDRVLDLEPRDWLAEALAETRKAEAMIEEADEKKEIARKEGTVPSHPLENYAGDYEHPGYGVVSIELADGQLRATYNDISSPLEHWHYDTFNAVGGEDDPALEDTKLLFRSDVSGEVAEVVIAVDPEVDAAVFKKQAEARLRDPAFLARLAGSYVFEAVGQKVEILLQGDRLTAVLPGQPSYGLEPLRGTEFALEGLSGFTVVFVLDGDRVTEVQFHQPNGVFTAVPKALE